MTDYKALCAELTDAVLSDDSHIDCAEIARRARAALAASPVPPADGEVAELVSHLLKVAAEDESDGCTYDSAFTRRAADLLERLALQPVPEGPTDEHILRLAREWNSGYESIEFEFISDFARAVLDRWGQP